MGKEMELREYLGKTYKFDNCYDGTKRIGKVVGIDMGEDMEEDMKYVLLVELKETNSESIEFDTARCGCEAKDLELIENFEEKEEKLYDWLKREQIIEELAPFATDVSFLEEEIALKGEKVLIKKSLAEQLEELKLKMDELQQQLESAQKVATKESDKRRLEKLKEQIKKDEWFFKEDLQYIWENSTEIDVFFMEEIDMSTQKSQMIIDVDGELYAFEVIEDKDGYCKLTDEMQRLIGVKCEETQKVIDINTYTLHSGTEYIREEE